MSKASKLKRIIKKKHKQIRKLHTPDGIKKQRRNVILNNPEPISKGQINKLKEQVKPYLLDWYGQPMVLLIMSSTITDFIKSYFDKDQLDDYQIRVSNQNYVVDDIMPQILYYSKHDYNRLINTSHINNKVDHHEAHQTLLSRLYTKIHITYDQCFNQRDITAFMRKYKSMASQLVSVMNYMIKKHKFTLYNCLIYDQLNPEMFNTVNLYDTTITEICNCDDELCTCATLNEDNEEIVNAEEDEDGFDYEYEEDEYGEYKSCEEDIPLECDMSNNDIFKFDDRINETQTTNEKPPIDVSTETKEHEDYDIDEEADDTDDCINDKNKPKQKPLCNHNICITTNYIANYRRQLEDFTNTIVKVHNQVRHNGTLARFYAQIVNKLRLYIDELYSNDAVYKVTDDTIQIVDSTK